MTKIEILNKYKKQKHNTYRECDVINAMEKYLESYKQAQALQLQQTGVSGSVFDEIYSDLTTISASLLTKKLSEFEEDWNFCKTTPKKDIYKILNNIEFQNSIQRSLANKLSSVKDKFFKHYR